MPRLSPTFAIYKRFILLLLGMAYFDYIPLKLFNIDINRFTFDFGFKLCKNAKRFYPKRLFPFRTYNLLHQLQ